jgi:molybdenum cofactor synthesis domain-containing protein
MLQPHEALERILALIPDALGTESVALRHAAGRRLAEEVVSDVDLPPFEKSMMDGFALRGADLPGPGELPCVGESRAGVPFEGEVPAGACVAIYTGAEVPKGLDAVVMVEETRGAGTGEGGEWGQPVRFERGAREGQNVGHQGEILRDGGRVFGPGRVLSPADLSVLASAGCDPVPVYRRPRISVLTTGDELVPPSERPGRGQIREGNTLQLAAAAEALGVDVQRTALLPDEPGELQRAFSAALDEGDALVTTGGVSVGRYDLVGAAFEAIGVEPVLHKVAIKPGKPIWFGLRDGKPVFGLPGNPLSSLLGFEVFVRPALLALGGAPADERAERRLRGRWLGPDRSARGRQWNLPATTRRADDGTVELLEVPWRGSADVVGAAAADALVVVPGDGAIASGEVVDYRPLT